MSFIAPAMFVWKIDDNDEKRTGKNMKKTKMTTIILAFLICVISVFVFLNVFQIIGPEQ